jgi:hypothetical protein
MIRKKVERRPEQVCMMFFIFNSRLILASLENRLPRLETDDRKAVLKKARAESHSRFELFGKGFKEHTPTDRI